MAVEQSEMKSIWYFAGMMLAVMGLLILASSVFDLFQASTSKTVLGELHPGLWWSVLMIFAGFVLVRISRRPSP